MRHLVAATACIAILYPCLSYADPDDGPVTFGYGAITCGLSLNTKNSQTGYEGWIMGYWSGLNDGVDKAGRIGASTENNIIIDEVRQECRAFPPHSLRDATLAVFLTFIRTHR